MIDRKLGIALLVLQILFIILFALLANYKSGSDHDDLHRYAYFQDVHTMIFIGFGFLMTFLRRYGYSAIGFNMMLAAVTIQWAMIVERTLEYRGPFELSFTNMIEADFCSAAVLISFGAVLGRLHPQQLLVMAMIEVVAFAVNIHIGLKYFKAIDAGSSIFVHTFGAYFGLAVAFCNHNPKHIDHKQASSVYHSDLFGMVGTVFLWICWPSFNAGIVEDEAGQYRALINTYLSLVGCTVSTFALSSLANKTGKIDIVHIQNSTLAGGVAVGCVANLVIQPYGALLIGVISGAVSVFGYNYISPVMAKKMRTFDTCGVHNLHGLPGILSALAAVVCILMANEETLGTDTFLATFPAMQSANQTLAGQGAVGYTKGTMVGMQLAALGCTLAFALVSGVITGILIKLPFCGSLTDRQAFVDDPFWELPEMQTEYVGLRTEQGVPMLPVID